MGTRTPFPVTVSECHGIHPAAFRGVPVRFIPVITSKLQASGYYNKIKIIFIISKYDEVIRM